MEEHGLLESGQRPVESESDPQTSLMQHAFILKSIAGDCFRLNTKMSFSPRDKCLGLPVN